MKKIFLVLIFFAAAAAAMAFYLSSSSLNYMEEVSGIKFPNHEIQETHDNMEMIFRAKLKLDTNRIEEFVTKNRFKKADTKKDLHKIAGLENWFEGSLYDSIPTGGNLYVHDSCYENNYVLYAVDAETGDFWGIINYSDPAGHAPCK